MNTDFETVKSLLPKQSFVKDLECFVVFGSSVVNSTMGNAPQDVDVCVVTHNRDADLQSITEFIFKCFPGPDYRIYFLDELKSKLPFMDKGVGIFALEYFANGISLYGENIFIDLLQKADKRKLKESYLNKIFEYVIRIREVKHSLAYDGKYKLWHIHKYSIRLLIDILLYKDILEYCELKNKTKFDLVELAKDSGIIPKDINVNFDSSNSLYQLFDKINLYLVETHKYTN